MLDLIWFYSWGQGYASASIRRQQFADEKSICFYSQKAARRSLAQKGLISYQSGTVSDPEFPQGRAAVYTPTTDLVAVAKRLDSVRKLHKNCTEHKCKITGGTRGEFCPTRGEKQLGVENTPSEKQPLLKPLVYSPLANPARSVTAADADCLLPPTQEQHSNPPTAAPLVHANTHAAVGGRSKQSASAATGRLAKRGEIAAAPKREPKPETPEEAAFIDFYVKGTEPRFKNGAPEGWHDRRKSLRAIRAFRRPGKTSVSIAVLTRCLKNAFDSDSVFPFKDNVFTLGDFLNTNQQHWMKFVNDPLRKKPARKPIAELLTGQSLWEEYKDDPTYVREMLNDPHFISFQKYTGWFLEESAWKETDPNFPLWVSDTWKKEMIDREQSLPPYLLMTRVIDFCLQKVEGQAMTLVPPCFIARRDSLRREENA